MQGLELPATAGLDDLEKNAPNEVAENRIPALRYCVWAAMITCWVIEGMSNRYSTYADGISYFDIAAACMKGQWRAAINAYWSPGYPVLLSFWLSIFHPSAYQRMPVIKIFNCVLLIVALACFEYFLRSVLEFTKGNASAIRETIPLPAWVFWATGYTIFFWATLYLSPPSLDTPDVLVFATLLLSAGILVRVAAGADGWTRFAVLGTVLGLGYLVKAVLFPLALVFLAVAPIAVGNLRRSIPRILLALLIFSIISTPLIILLSRSKGRLTFNDTSRIAYTEYVDGAKLFVHWQGDPPGSGLPKHPTRKILESPAVYEFASPIAGTYPPWNDPSYWYDGVHPHFSLGGQLNALRHGLDDYNELAMRLGSLLTGIVALLLYGNPIRYFQKTFLFAGFLWIPALTGLGMYALVHVDPRFLGGFVILLWAATFSAIRIPQTDSGRAIVRCVTLAIVLVLGVQIVWMMGHNVVRLASFKAPADVEVAHELNDAGIFPGENVACVGSVLLDHVWAYLAGVTIIDEVSPDDVAGFWSASPEMKARVLNLLSKSGAKAVIASNVPPSLVSDGWKRLGMTNFFMLNFSGTGSIASTGLQ